MMKKVIITGAGGFIGGALTQKLIDKNITVYGVDISENMLKKFGGYKNFIPIIADFSRYENLHEMIKDEIDVFYHLAWQGVFGEAFKNYELQLNNTKYACDALVQAIKIKAKKFVFAGTYNEFEIHNIAFSDSIDPRYTCIYASAKFAGDMMCKTIANQNGINYSSALVSMAYGEGNRSNMLANVLIDSFNNGIRPKLIEGNNLYDFVYIDDVANAYVAIGEKGHNLKSYYVGHRKLKTFREWVTEIKDIIAPEMQLVFGEYSDSQTIDYSKIDLNALYNDTGFECKSDFKESILKTAEWLKGQ